jgi:Na+/phosphate symporter
MHILDTTVIAVVSISAAASTLILGTADTAQQIAELKLLLLPFLGALVMSGGIILLNPQIETRRIVIGRSIVALFCGSLAPQLIAIIHPNLVNISIKPVAQIAIGGLIAVIAYIMSKPFTNQLYSHADGIAKDQADKLQKKLGRE